MMNMKFIIASNNKKKLVELERILNPLGINAVTPKEEGITLDDVDENGTTFAENAFLKANAAYLKRDFRLLPMIRVCVLTLLTADPAFTRLAMAVKA